jgi:predicted nucleic acid-binding protein
VSAEVSHCVVLDAQAATAVAEESRTIRDWLAWIRRTDSTIHVSAATITEIADGSSRDANVRRALKAVNVVAVTEQIAFTAGRLRASARGRRKARDLTVDAIVAATATSLHPPVVVLTGDPSDLRILLSGTGVRVEQIG